MSAQSQIVFWLAIGLLAIVAVLTLQSVMLPFVTGIVIAYAFNPLADRLNQLGLPRIAAAGLIVALFFALVVAVCVFVLPIVVSQIQQLIATLPAEIDRLRGLVETWARERLGENFAAFQQMLNGGVADFSANWTTIAGIVARSIWTQGQSLISFISLLLITPVVVFYVLVDWNGMVARIDSWLPRAHAPTLRRLASDIDSAISAFIRGQGLVCVILGCYYVIALSAAGLTYGLLVGILTGIMSFVPFVGWALGLISALILAAIQSWPDPTLMFIVLAIFAGSQVLDAAFLSPQIVGSRIGLHPVWLIFALMTFSYLFGIIGVLVAVPLAAATGVLVRFSLESYLSSDFYSGHSADGSPVQTGSSHEAPATTVTAAPATQAAMENTRS